MPPGAAGRLPCKIREVNSGAAKREAREKLLEAARRREIDVVLVWRLDRWGRSVTDLLATLQELEHLGRGFRVADRGAGPDHARRSGDGRPAGRLRCIRTGDPAVNEPGLAWPMRGRTGNGWVGRQPRPYTLRKSGNCIVPVLANPRSLVECRSGAPQSAESWEQSHELSTDLPAAAPEPLTWAMLSLGAAAFVAKRRRRKM